MAANPERINRIDHNSNKTKEVPKGNITLADSLFYKSNGEANTSQLSQLWDALNNKDISPFLQQNANKGAA